MRLISLTDTPMKMPWGRTIAPGGRLAIDAAQLASVRSSPNGARWLANGMLAVEGEPAAPAVAAEPEPEAEPEPAADEDDEDEAPSPDLDALRATATARGVKFSRRWGAARLLQAIEAAG